MNPYGDHASCEYEYYSDPLSSKNKIFSEVKSSTILNLEIVDIKITGIQITLIMSTLKTLD